MKKLLLLIVLCIGVCSTVIGQPRPAEKAQLPDRPVAAAAAVFNAKYQGGVFGFSEKETGTLKELYFMERTGKKCSVYLSNRF